MNEFAIPTHGGQLRALAQQFGVSEESLLDFSASIHPSAPSAGVMEKLGQHLRTRPELLSTYPEATYADLRDAIGKYAGVHLDGVAVSNGVMPLLQASASALGLKRCLVFLPAFSDYERTLRMAGCTAIPVLLKPSNDFRLSIEDISRAFETEGTDSLLLANPHSPSGVLLAEDVLKEIAKRAEDAGKVVILDEAFIDYAPQASLARLAERSRNLFVLRSLTKYFAIPGARVAYLVADPDGIKSVNAALPLWSVDSIAALLAQLLISEDSSRRRDEMDHERSWLSAQLAELGLHVFPGRANFLLFSIDDPGDLWRRMILEHGVVLRACGNFTGLDERFFRVAVRSRPENTRLMQALRSCLGTP